MAQLLEQQHVRCTYKASISTRTKHLDDHFNGPRSAVWWMIMFNKPHLDKQVLRHLEWLDRWWQQRTWPPAAWDPSPCQQHRQDWQRRKCRGQWWCAFQEKEADRPHLGTCVGAGRRHPRLGHTPWSLKVGMAHAS